MSLRKIVVATAAVLVTTPLSGATDSPVTENIWGRICGVDFEQNAASSVWHLLPQAPVATCPPAPTTYQSLVSVGGTADTSVNFNIGYDPDSARLCFAATGLPEAPVLRVGVGHTLSVQIANTLHDTGKPPEADCAIDTYGGEGLCEAKSVFSEKPGADGSFYPIMANEAHNADGTSNLHVQGLFVPPVACSDEVLNSTIYPANWGGRVAALPPRQATPSTLGYSYKLPADHPAGAYRYHTHRHGQAEHQSQMGLVGAIVVEDQGDVWRNSIGVTDEVLLVTDVPNVACLVGPSCYVPAGSRTTKHMARRATKVASSCGPCCSTARPCPKRRRAFRRITSC